MQWSQSYKVIEIISYKCDHSIIPIIAAGLMCTQLLIFYCKSISIFWSWFSLFLSGGFAFLPFLWLVNVVWFFREAFVKPAYTEQLQIKTCKCQNLLWNTGTTRSTEFHVFPMFPLPPLNLENVWTPYSLVGQRMFLLGAICLFVNGTLFYFIFLLSSLTSNGLIGGCGELKGSPETDFSCHSYDLWQFLNMLSLPKLETRETRLICHILKTCFRAISVTANGRLFLQSLTMFTCIE